LTGEPDGDGGGFGAFYSFGVAVGDFGHLFGQETSLLKVGCDICASAYPHGSAIAIAVVWRGIIRTEPKPKAIAVAGVWILAPQTLHTGNDLLPKFREVTLTCHDGISDGKRHDAVIRDLALFCHELEFFGLVIIKLKSGTDNIADDCSEHLSSFTSHEISALTPV
jgi:hypothetical protein